MVKNISSRAPDHARIGRSTVVFWGGLSFVLVLLTLIWIFLPVKAWVDAFAAWVLQFGLLGALVFSIRPQFRLPVFTVKAVCYPGTEVADVYLDSQDIVGKLADIFQKTLAFILGNLRHIQGSGSVNSEGEPEIARIAVEEIVANALIHRDYFVPAPVRVFVFSNRVEIVSPGHLPNNLTVENIKNGNSNIRNPILASFAAKLFIIKLCCKPK